MKTPPLALLTLCLACTETPSGATSSASASAAPSKSPPSPSASGSSKATPDRPVPPASKSPPSPSASGSSKATPDRPVPPVRKHGTPTADRLGTLPDGVGLAVGTHVPPVRVLDLDGKEVSLSSLYEKGDILLFFYRGGWCPFCNFQIRATHDARAEFARRGVTPVFISVDRPSRAEQTRAAHQATFPILSNPSLRAHEAFGVKNVLADALVRRHAERGHDIEGYSGKAHHTIAIPAIFLIDQGGIVRFAHAHGNYKVRPSTEQLLSAIDRLHAG